MRRILLVAAASVAVLAVPSTTAAQACAYIDIAGAAYVTEDLNWAYVETNGIAGLQRGQGGTFDSTDYYSAPDGTCLYDGTPDSKIY